MEVSQTDLCLLLITFFLAVTGAQVHLVATPSEIRLCCTDILNIHCRFARNTTSITFVASVFILYQPFSSTAPFNDLASVYEHDDLYDLHSYSDDIVVAGLINSKSDDFLLVQWSKPTAHQAGNYKCVVNGMDEVGHPIVISADTQVLVSTARSSDSDADFTEIQE